MGSPGGTLADNAITCAGHGTVWDLKTGKGVFDAPLEDEQQFAAREDNGILYVMEL